MSDHSELKRLAEACGDLNWRAIQENWSEWAIRDDHAYIALMRTKSAKQPGPCPEREAKAKFLCSVTPYAVLALIAEVEALRKDRTDWQAECLKRGFEYVRESDDHYVLADVPEMADLLGALLGVEVRNKENDAYEEANSQLNEQIEGLINTIHAQEALRKDAERYRWLRDSSESIHQFYLSTPVWFTGVKFSKDNVDSTIDAAMTQGAKS